MVAGAQAPQVSLDSDFDAALGHIGLSTKTATFDPSLMRLYRSGKYPTPLYLSCSDNPWSIPFMMDVTRKDLAAYSGRPNESFNSLARFTGVVTRRMLLGNPIAKSEEAAAKPGALTEILNRFYRSGIMKTKPAAPKDVPAEVQQAAALILNVAVQARSYRNLSLADFDSRAAYAQIGRSTAEESNVEGVREELRAYDGFRINYMEAGGHDMILAAQRAEALCAKVPAGTSYLYRIRTVWGIIELSGGKDSGHTDADTFLLIDTGGNDLYVDCPANGSLSNWSSVVIDTNGNDKYVSDKALVDTPVSRWDKRRSGGNKPGPAGALFGYSILIDSAGSDLYRTHRPGLGSARLGVGVLLDKGGDDQYDAYIDSEGFGLFGGGILEDVSGSDIYRGFMQVQGCGLTGGFGYLVDRSGDDKYIAEDQVIDFPSPQSAQHNVSMSQGAGNGRRADYLDSESLAGGVGVLSDQMGDDSYSAAVFAQGVGYWEGVGALWDEAGKDAYIGMWYVQGASAHYAIGYVEDLSGDDTYTAPMNMAMGAGHDFSVGVLVDRAGNDAYKGPNLSLGAGNSNGIGIFVEMAGNDSYESSGITLGKGAEAAVDTLRIRGLCLGTFLDLGGSDTYPAAADWAKNGASVANWTGRGPSPQQSQLGVFMDR